MLQRLTIVPSETNSGPRMGGAYNEAREKVKEEEIGLD